MPLHVLALAVAGASVAAACAPRCRRPSSEKPGEELIDVEVRLLSGSLAARLRPSSADSVESLRRAAGGAELRSVPTQLVLGARVLCPSETLRGAGISAGATLTLVRRAFSWEAAAMGRHCELQLRDGRRTVRRSLSFDNAVVVARSPARFFRFRVLETDAFWSGAAELGFTALAPSQDSLPDVARVLPKSWVLACNGKLFVDGCVQERWQVPRVNWTEAWAPGDVVTCSMAEGGEFRIEVNGTLAMEAALGIAATPELFPVIGVYGKTLAVELLDG